MSDDEQTLRDLNRRIGDAEAAGDIGFLADVLASRLAFRRANGVCVDRDGFLKAVANSAKRDTEIESVEVFGRDRAVVSCIVTLTDGPTVKRFHNLRLFVRDHCSQWKLLGWANESLP
jgi:hypothetical protein